MFFLLGAQQVHLHKCLQVSRVFSVLRWGIFVTVDNVFISVGRGEEKNIVQTEAKKKNTWDFFYFAV